MVDIIPSINVSSIEELERTILLVEPYATWAHIDVSDGVFTSHINWNNPRELFGFKTSLNLEVHLMVQNPEKEIDDWVKTPVGRIIFHQEATSAHQLLIDKIHDAKMEAGVAIKPDTQWIKLLPFFDKAELLQLLAVTPGPSGQRFNEEILHKLGHIRSLCKKCIIEIDGGVNTAIAHRCSMAGANLLIAGNAIFGGGDIEKNIERLKKATNIETMFSHLPRKVIV